MFATVDISVTAVCDLSYCSYHLPFCQKMRSGAGITSHHQEEDRAQGFDSACPIHLQIYACFI